MLKAKLLNSQFKVFNLIIGSVFFTLLLFAVKVNFAKAWENGNEVKTIVIDAGHGGHDSGCIGHTRVNEKVVALNIALLLGGYIEKNMSDVKVIYTRKTDVFVELEERAAIANRNNADLFISIHCNAASPAAYGTETYVMGLHKTEGNLNVAKRENSVINLEENQDSYAGMDLNSDEAYIIMSLTQSAHLIQSTLLAQNIQKQFTERVGRHNRGVKSAGFWVLWRTTMPSVLIETGFLTNASEEKFLNSKQGQEYIASAIFRAVRDYKGEVEKSTNSLDQIKELNVSIVSEIQHDKPEEVAPEQVLQEEIVTEEYLSTTSYRVQLMVSSRGLESFGKQFKKVDNLIIENLENNLYRYSAGPFNSNNEAETALNKLKSQGFKDAFITVYKGNERVAIVR